MTVGFSRSLSWTLSKSSTVVSNRRRSAIRLTSSATSWAFPVSEPYKIRAVRGLSLHDLFRLIRDMTTPTGSGHFKSLYLTHVFKFSCLLSEAILPLTRPSLSINSTNPFVVLEAVHLVICVTLPESKLPVSHFSRPKMRHIIGRSDPRTSSQMPPKRRHTTGMTNQSGDCPTKVLFACDPCTKFI